MDAEAAAAQLVEQTRARPWGLAVAVLADDNIVYRFAPGRDPLNGATLFQVGSLTKTMTGVALATAVVSGELTLGATIGDLLDIDGPVGDITLLELATQRSGLPRLPVNLDLATVNRADPYPEFSVDDLLGGLESTSVGTKEFGYSNLGFMILGLVLQRHLNRPYGEILKERVFVPLAVHTAGCPPNCSNAMNRRCLSAGEERGDLANGRCARLVLGAPANEQVGVARAGFDECALSCHLLAFNCTLVDGPRRRQASPQVKRRGGVPRRASRARRRG